MGRLLRARSGQPPVDARVAELAAAQFGVFSRVQAARAGATGDAIRYRIATGRWEQVTPYVFRLAGAPPSWRRSLMEACLAWGDGSAISHRSAGGLWRLSGFEPEPVELTVPRRRERRAPGVVHRNALSSVDLTAVDGIPVTTPARTLIDIASVSPRDVVEEALDDALRRGLVSISRVRWRLDALGGGRCGVAFMRALLDDRDPAASVPQSGFERRLLRILKRAGFPDPVLQHRVRDGGRLIAVVDFAYPRHRLAIEADGYRWHSGKARWQHDRERGNDLTLLGWRVIHVTWDDLTNRCDAVVDSIRAAIMTS
ncbi:MAG: DUF559 domain-containing protein [Actinomycetota bacterium]